MQEQVSIRLDEEFIAGDRQNEKLLYAELSKHIETIKDLLIGYHFSSRGRVYNVSIDETSIELINPSIAKFSANYSIGQFNACADLDFSESARMEILLDIDAEKSVALLTGEYIPEREPDEF